MSNTKKYNSGHDNHVDDFFDKTQPVFKKSKEEVWDQIALNIEDHKRPKRNIRPFTISFAIAASLVLLMGIFTVLRFYQTTIECPAGSHITASLPDGSTVALNAESQISYYPYWWRFSRTVKFSGEGFFKVKPGEKFTVSSSLAKTIVLGTSFNVYSRNGKYEVSCLTGKVKVVSNNKKEGILSPGYQARLSLDGEVVIYKSENAESSISWIDNKFIFTAVPLGRVFEEIERQYNVRIRVPSHMNYTYTGYFTKDKPIVEVLGLVCKPFGLKFVANSDNSFEVVQN